MKAVKDILKTGRSDIFGEMPYGDENRYYGIVEIYDTVYDKVFIEIVDKNNIIEIMLVTTDEFEEGNKFEAHNRRNKSG